MDVMEMVKTAAPSAEVDDVLIAATRHRVMTEVRVGATAKPRQRRRRGIAWGVGVVTAGAAVAVGAIVATNLLPVDPDGPGVPPVLVPPPASASEVLERAAEHTTVDDALAPKQGQYLRIDETMSFLEFAQPDAVTGELMPMGHRGSAQAAFVTSRTTSLYVPADRDDEWVWDLRGAWSVGEKWGADADSAVQAWQRLREDGGDTPELWRLPGGRDPQNTEKPDATLDGRESFAEVPRDPQELLDWFRAGTGAEGAEADAAAVWTMSSTLSSALAPADIRAAIFQALALVEGMVVDDPGAELATFTFSATGDDWSRTTRFMLDTKRSLITELSETMLPAEESIVPADVPDEHRTVQVSIVDTAP